MKRGAFLGAGAAAGIATVPLLARGDETVLPAWTRGTLDIHHLSTGRGNATLFVFPDGTTLLLDAGSVGGPTEFLAPARPDASRRPGEWIGRYVARQLRAAGSDALDYAVLTHFHPDHLGAIDATSPMSRDGRFRLSGLTDVAEIVPIRHLFDRGFPGYAYPTELRDPMMQNYRAFVAAMQSRGTIVDAVHVGRDDQIATRSPGAARIRVLAANGEVWTGNGTATEQRFPPPPALPPDENMCSVALRVNVGRFAYFTGGDLTATTNDGADPWRDIETPVASVAGRVDVAALDHHGYYDAVGAGFVRSLDPRVCVLQAWHVTHPALSTLDRLFNPRVSPTARDVFATALTPAAAAVNDRLVPKLRSTAGHVIVRVAPGGERYTVIVVDDRDESGRVLAQFGPYDAR